MKNAFSFLLLVSVCCFGQQTLAGQFQSQIEDAQGSCPSLECLQSRVHLGDSPIKKENLPPSLVQNLEQTARDFSQLWADTILEGDYWSENVTTLSQIEAVFEENSLIGYRLTYLQKAWDISTCEYAPANHTFEARPTKCAEGRIIESAFVSIELSEAFVDQFARAQFRRIKD